MPVLQGQVILNTRPAHQQAELGALLQQEGARVLNFPVIQIAPAAAPAKTVDSAACDILLFVSRNAVDGAFRLFDPARLAEVDARKLYRPLGFPSLYRYALEDLGLSEACAGHRITAARLARRFPIVLEHVARGDLHLAGLKVLSPYITDANHCELFDAARGKTRREIEELLAARFPTSDVLHNPQPDLPDRVCPTGCGQFNTFSLT